MRFVGEFIKMIVASLKEGDFFKNMFWSLIMEDDILLLILRVVEVLWWGYKRLARLDVRVDCEMIAWIQIILWERQMFCDRLWCFFDGQMVIQMSFSFTWTIILHFFAFLFVDGVLFLQLFFRPTFRHYLILFVEEFHVVCLVHGWAEIITVFV